MKLMIVLKPFSAFINQIAKKLSFVTYTIVKTDQSILTDIFINNEPINVIVAPIVKEFVYLYNLLICYEHKCLSKK